jgi:hypothetical protein
MRANRANARASTGPKTAQGRAKSATNALRHALSVPIHSDPVFSQEIEALARSLASTDADAEIQELACQIAEAQVALGRVRSARHELLSEALGNRYYDSRANVRLKLRFIGELLRPNAPEIPLSVVAKIITATPQGPEKLATILSEELEHLRALDRYERRAFSRRKFAIRAFDVAYQNRADPHNATISCREDAFSRTKPKY